MCFDPIAPRHTLEAPRQYHRPLGPRPLLSWSTAMPRTGWSPTTIPYGADQTVYLVIDRFSSGSLYRETEIERSDLETIISEFMTGQFNDPVRVVAFNTLERWADDVSKDVAQEVEAR